MNASPKRVEISSFPGGKRIAVTTSFDDGVVHDRRVVQAFNEWGLKGTFNLNSGGFGLEGRVAANEVAELYRGHEVAVHTVTHPHLPKLDSAQVAREVLEDRMALEDLVGYPVRGMAYPFGTYDQRVIGVLRNLGIAYARTTETSPNCFPPRDPLAWAATAHQYEMIPKTVPDRFTEYHTNPKSSGVFFIWGHSYEFNDRNDWDGLKRIFQPLAGLSDVWYCTNIELFDYEYARRRLVIAANRRTAHNPSALPVTVNVDGKLLDVPVGKTIALQAG